MYNRASLLVFLWKFAVTRPGLFFKNSQPISVGAGVLGYPGRSRQSLATAVQADAGETFKKFWCSHDAICLCSRGSNRGGGASLVPIRKAMRRGMGPTSIELLAKIELKSLILAQIERWRHALHMQVERQRGGNPGGERRTGE